MLIKNIGSFIDLTYDRLLREEDFPHMIMIVYYITKIYTKIIYNSTIRKVFSLNL